MNKARIALECITEEEKWPQRESKCKSKSKKIIIENFKHLVFCNIKEEKTKT